MVVGGNRSGDAMGVCTFRRKRRHGVSLAVQYSPDNGVGIERFCRLE